MPDIKRKPQMVKPKVVEVDYMLKEVSTILKERYEQQKIERKPEEGGSVQYATDRVERSTRQLAAMTGGTIQRGVNKRRSAAKTQTKARTDDRHPTRASPTNKNAPSPQERGRSKAIQEHKAKTKERYLTEKETATINAPKIVPRRTVEASLRMRKKVAAAKRVKENAQRQMLRQATAKAKKAAQETAKSVTRIAKAAARAIAAAAKAIIAVGGGVALLVAVMLVALIAAIAASPFGIFFSGENIAAGAVPMSVAMAEVDFDFNARLMELQSVGSYDDVVMHGAAPDRTDVLAVFASKVAGGDSADAADVVTMDRARIDKLKAVFWDMTEISTEVQTIHHPDSDPDDDIDDSWTECILHITVSAKTADEMADIYRFTSRQRSSLAALLAQRAMLTELVGSLSTLDADTADMLENLPSDISAERKAVVEAACSLVGKVNYFWGGKSYAKGWDTRWGQLQKVTSAGSPTTGTHRPYGLDCSGFVDWVFYNATDGAYIPSHGGGSEAQHRYCTDIPWEDAQPGDLVFYPDDEHVGIIVGRDEHGALQVAHCAAGANGVVVTGAGGFTAVGIPHRSDSSL